MDKAERFWDGRAGAYDAQDGTEDPADSELVQSIRRHLDPDAVVLDYGCATGTWTLALAGSVRELHGLDISGKMIELARGKAAAKGAGNVRFHQGTIFNAGLDRGSFDAILALNILHLLADRPRVVNRIRDLLKPGGAFISETPCLGQKRSLLGVLMRGVSKMGLVPHLSNLTVADVDSLLAGAGLQLVAAETRPDSVISYFAVARKP